MHVAVFGFLCGTGIIGVCVVLLHSGLTQPQALLGATVVTLYFGSATAKEIRYKRSERTTAFLAERSRITATLLNDSDLESALAKLGSGYRVALDASGLSLKNGRCRIVDLAGPSTRTRLEIKNNQIRTYKIFPPYGK